MITETRLTVEYGLTKWLAVGLVAPFRVLGASITYLDAKTNAPIDIASSGIHHRDETLTGLGDPLLWLRAGTTLEDWTLGLRVGATLPLGRTEPNPFDEDGRGEPHQHFQFGTGALAPIFALEATRRFDGWALDARLWTQQNVAENRFRWLPGDRYRATVAARSPLGTQAWGFHGGLTLSGETPERWDPPANMAEGNLGRKDLLVQAGAVYTLWKSTYVGAMVQVPVYTDVGDGQIDYPFIVTFSIGGVFDLFDEPHDHGAAPERAGWTGLDVADVEADDLDLTPVPGKITVFDFWATWCEPCVHLEALLSVISREHPGTIAVRRIDVTDEASPFWARYLESGSVGLPFVRVYGPDGELLFEYSGSPDVIVQKLEAVID